MAKLGKVGAAAVLGLLLGLVVFTTGAFAQNVEQKNVDRGNISILAHAATVTGIKHGGCVGTGCSRGGVGVGFAGGRGFGGGFGFAGGSGFGGGFGCSNSCGVRVRRITQVQTRTRIIQECRLNFWGRACRSTRVSERRVTTRSDFRSGNGFDDWAVGVGIQR